MKSNSTELKSLLANKNLGFASLLEFNWNPNYYFTDYPHNVVWDGKTFLTDNPIVSGSNPRYTTVVDRELFSMQLSGLDVEMVALVERGIINMPVKMNLLLIVDGTPMLGLDQTMNFYEGRVSKSTMVTSDDTKLIDIELTAPLSDLDATGTIFTTKDGIALFDSTDTCFDEVSTGSEAVSIKWGKV